jgi:chromosome segregation ATPase
MATHKAAAGGAVLGDGQQTIEQLQQRYEQLNRQKIQCETKLESAREQLENLKREAREKYGTDDLGDLQAKLEQMKADNEQKRAAYQADLDRIEGELAQVEQNFQVTEASGKAVS